VNSIQERKELPKKKKAKRTPLDRAIEAVGGGFVAYISSSATTDPLRIILLIIGLLIILHAILSE